MNVLIVDDQKDVVAGIRDGVAWDRLPVDCIFTATGGAGARKLLETEDIAILLCDIEMPGENGLELCRWAKSRFPSLEVVFLTSHADFEYARTALHMGSFDYLLQPATYEEITACVQKLCARIVERQAMQRNAREGAVFKEKRDLLLEDALCHFTMKESGAKSFGEILPLFLERRYTELILFPVLLTMHWKGAQPEHWDGAAYKQQLRKALLEIFSPLLMEIIVSNEIDGRFWIFLCGEKAMSDVLDCIGGLVRFKASEPDDGFYTALFYRQWTGLSGLETVMHDISQMAGDKIVPTASLYSFKEPEACGSGNTNFLYMLNTRSWPRWLEENRGDVLKQELTRFFEDEKNCERMNRETLKYLYFRLLEAVLSVVSKKQLKLEQIFPSDKSLKILSEGCIKYSYFIECVDTVTSFFTPDREQAPEDTSLVEKAVNFIKDHPDKNLTRNEVASHVHLNPEYFSRLFKRETGYTVADFIFKEKMKLARQLLESTRLSVSMIAMKVGYSNFSHFTQLFKKVYGMTPNEYRKSCAQK